MSGFGEAQRADRDREVHVSAPAPPRRCGARRTPGRRGTSARSAALRPQSAGQDDAAVAAAEAAAHDLLERDGAGPPVLFRRAVATARIIGVGPQTYSCDAVRRSPSVARRVAERSGDEAFRAAAAVFGRQDDPDAEALEEVDVIELGRAPGAVEQRRRRAARVQRFRKRQERREPDAAGNHPRLRRRVDRLERLPEGSETGDARARLDFVQQPRADRRCACSEARCRPVRRSRSRRISKIENGRRSSGSIPRDGLTITN